MSNSFLGEYYLTAARFKFAAWVFETSEDYERKAINKSYNWRNWTFYPASLCAIQRFCDGKEVFMLFDESEAPTDEDFGWHCSCSHDCCGCSALTGYKRIFFGLIKRYSYQRNY